MKLALALISMAFIGLYPADNAASFSAQQQETLTAGAYDPPPSPPNDPDTPPPPPPDPFRKA